MSLGTLTYDEAVEALRTAVALKGADYRYFDHFIDCQNFDVDGRPCCIAGHVYAMQVPTINRVENAYATVSSVAEHSVLMDQRTRDLLTIAQNLQDYGYTWGFALEKALEGNVRRYSRENLSYERDALDDAYWEKSQREKAAQS